MSSQTKCLTALLEFLHNARFEGHDPPPGAEEKQMITGNTAKVSEPQDGPEHITALGGQ
jgi:hypothetical protein